MSYCKGFLLQFSLYFTTQIGATDQQKVAQLINLLTGKALKWATAIWEKGEEPTTSYKCFIEMFHWVFAHSLEDVEVGEQLLTIKQGSRWVAEYTLEFCTITMGSGWNEPTLKVAFCQGLDPIILTELACWDEQTTLDSLIDLSIHLDHLLQNCPSLQGYVTEALSFETPTPMDISHTLQTQS